MGKQLGTELGSKSMVRNMEGDWDGYDDVGATEGDCDGDEMEGECDGDSVGYDAVGDAVGV